MEHFFMNHIMFISSILAIHFSLLAMEAPESNSQKDKEGIFLESIVSEYEDPLTITLMPLIHHSSGDCWVDEAYVRDNPHKMIPLAKVSKEKCEIYASQLETHQKSKPFYDDKHATIRELAVLRVQSEKEDRHADVWMRKYLKLHRIDSGNRRGQFFVNGREVVEHFSFDWNQYSHTSVTLKIPQNLRSFRGITVESNTIPLGRTFMVNELGKIVPSLP